MCGLRDRAGIAGRAVVMSIDLVAEVLDHYHGPHSRKLWLIAWAEKVSNGHGSRTGYCKREILADRLGVSPVRVSNIARELVDEGVLRRLGGGVWNKSAEYELLPLAAHGAAPQGNPRANPTQGNPRANPAKDPGTNPQGNPRANAQGNPRANPNPHNPHQPSSARTRGPADIIRAVYPDATDDEIEIIIKGREDHGARSVVAVLDYEIREGTLRLPCDRGAPYDGVRPHSQACRDGDPGRCGMDWCACRCHLEPVRQP